MLSQALIPSCETCGGDLAAGQRRFCSNLCRARGVGEQKRGKPRSTVVVEKVRAAKAEQTAAIAGRVARGACGTAGCSDPGCGIVYGLCHCGCGAAAPTARQSDRKRGFVRGEPMRFRLGHNRRFGTLGARDHGKPLADAIAKSGMTERQIALQAGVSPGAFSSFVDVAGKRLGIDRCERLVAVIADALSSRGVSAPLLDDLFDRDVVLEELRGRRERPALERQKRYDGRHFKTAEHRALAQKVACKRMVKIQAELEAIKAERSLLDANQVAAQLYVHPAYVHQLARSGHLAAERVRIEGSPRVRVLFSLEGVRALKQAWAREPGQLLLDPSEYVAQADLLCWTAKLSERKGLSLDEARDVLRGRAKRRRAAVITHRRGRKPRVGPPLHHVEWLEAFLVLRADLKADYEDRCELEILIEGERPPSDWLVAEAVAATDFAMYPARWGAEYESPRDHGELDPMKSRVAAQRVWKAIKPLLSAQTEIAAS